MLPAGLDDEQRAHLAHEHPTDLDSSPSSPSSGTPAYFDPRRRSKSASRHRSHTAADESSTSHLLAQLVSREEEVREINAALVVTTERLEGESSRANAAERRALDYFHRLRIATENRERSEQESARLREELKLYKLQLENAQKEIFRAQDIIDQVASQRNEAEAEAARARTKARKLQEEKLVMLAREDGRRMGYKEGLSIGRRIGYDEEDHDGDNVREHDEDITDDERIDPRFRIQMPSVASIRQQPMRSESAPPVRTSETALHAPPLPIPSRVRPVRVHTPSHQNRTPSPPHESDEPETIHPRPIRPSPIIPTPPNNIPPDGWIPRADSRTSYIMIPSPHELQPPVPTSPSSVATEVHDSRPTYQSEPTPVPPPVRTRDYAYQPSALPPIQVARTSSSLASRTSTHISQYDLVNKRPGSSLRNEITTGRARSGSQPSRGSMSRNEHRDQESRYSDRTEAEDIIDQWRADSDVMNPPRNPPRSSTPSARSHRPAHFYYRPREIVTPVPLGDIGEDPRSRTPAPTEPTAQSPPDDPAASNPARVRSPLDYLRQRFRQRPSSGSTIPNIVVESPSEPETAISPSATIAAQPELLSPEAANRPLPQDDPGQYQYQQQQQHPPQQQHHRHHHHAHSQPHDPRHHHHRAPSTTYDTAPRSGTPSTSQTQGWPAGFVPYSSTTETKSSASEKERRRTRPDHDPIPESNRSRRIVHARTYSHPSSESSAGYTRARTQSASASAYEAAPLPPGVTYPAPPVGPVRPHTSHRHYRDRDMDRDRDRDREWERDRDRDRVRTRARDVVHDRDWDRERDRDRRRYPGRDYERERDRRGDREQDPEDIGISDELTRSPAPLQRPISLFDSDEA